MIKIVKTKYLETCGSFINDNTKSDDYWVEGYYVVKNNQYVIQPYKVELFESIGEFVNNYRNGACFISYIDSHKRLMLYSEVVEEYETEKELYEQYPEYLI